MLLTAWLMCRRAKTKCLARKGFGEGADVSAETMRQYLAQQSLDGKPFSPDLLQHSDANERLSLDDSASNSKTSECAYGFEKIANPAVKSSNICPANRSASGHGIVPARTRWTWSYSTHQTMLV